MATEVKRTPEELEKRKKFFEIRREELTMECKRCVTALGMPTVDHCNHGCGTGYRLRMLEVEFADITGWSHEHWGK